MPEPERFVAIAQGAASAGQDSAPHGANPVLEAAKALVFRACTVRDASSMSRENQKGFHGRKNACHRTLMSVRRI